MVSSNINSEMDTSNSPFEFDKVIKEVDSIIAQCMKDMTHEDRQQSYLEVHGVLDEFQETPEAIEKALDDLKAQIDKMVKKEALELAESMDADYVNDPGLRLKFLRGERFNVIHAAEKFVNHFELKRELFGERKLVKEIEQDDLDEDDLKALYSGYVQWLPLRDISGRTVTVFFPGKTASKASRISRQKVFFYLRMVGMEDEAFQRKGMVCITVSTVGSDELENFESPHGMQVSVKEMARLSEALPGYTQCMHVCFSNLSSIGAFIVFNLVRLMILAFSNLITIRVRIHQGSSQQETTNKLQAFGIPVSVIPRSAIDNEYHIAVMQRRKRLEFKRRQRKLRQNDEASKVSVQSSDQERVEDSDSDGDDAFAVSFDPLDENCHWICTGPEPKDVILGRGRKTNNHAGNIRLRTMVEELSDVYKASSKKEKTEITQRIVASIQGSGRFLKESDMLGWVEVPDEVARIKVSHAFRDSYKVKRKQNGGGDNNKRSIQTMVGKKHELQGLQATQPRLRQ